jgi:cytochrome c oxidase assembly protein subunit 11
MTQQQQQRPTAVRDVVVASACGACVALMVAAAYAAVPLYDWFCRVTGFNGTTQIASGAPGQISDRVVTVRFDANVGPGLPWKFAPERTEIQARLGEVVTVDYTVTNTVARETHGVAGYNVTPLAWGAYFHKINCFCFTEQTMKPGETRAMTVVFYVDPALANDADVRGNPSLTLSYTFYPQRTPQRPVAQSGSAPAGRI